MKNIGKGPIVLTLSFVTIIMTLATIKLGYWQTQMQLAGIFVIGIYVFWMLIELKVALRDASRGATKMDHGTYQFYALGRALTVLSALTIPTNWTNFGLWAYLAIGLLVFGIGLRLLSIKVLGKFYSHWVRVADEHQIICTGPYHFLRHPSYSGMLLAHTGFVLFFFNWVSLLFLIGGFIPAVIYRILVEEKALLSIKGYEDYCTNRKRVIPFVW